MRCGASQKKPLRDSTHSTALSGLIFWDVPQIAAYREKFLVRRVPSATLGEKGDDG